MRKRGDAETRKWVIVLVSFCMDFGPHFIYGTLFMNGHESITLIETYLHDIMDWLHVILSM